jgi:hypothetical protein
LGNPSNGLNIFYVFQLPRHLSNFLDKKALFDFSWDFNKFKETKIWKNVDQNSTHS